MKILVTGASGFVGRHLIAELLSNAHIPIGVDRVSDSPIEGAKTLQVDLEDADSLKTKINFNEVDAVIHLAGLAAVGPSFENPMLYISTNLGIEVNLFETALKQDAKPRFLIISSGALYDPKGKLPLSEKSSVVPSSPYAVSKIGQEQMAHYYGLREFDYMVARPFNHIGPGQNEGFIVPDLAKQIVQAEKGAIREISVGNLDAKRDYTDVRDIVRAYRLLIEKGVNGETYNICSGKSVSGHKILEGLLKHSDTKPKVIPDSAKMRPSDTKDIYGDISKISKDTGWKPRIDIEKTLGDCMDDWRSRLS